MDNFTEQEIKDAIERSQEVLVKLKNGDSVWMNPEAKEEYDKTGWFPLQITPDWVIDLINSKPRKIKISDKYKGTSIF